MAFHLSCLIFLVFLPSICMPAEIKAPSFKGEVEFTGGILNYANFIRFLNHKLNHSEVVEARAVRDEDECMAACTENSNCRSLNFKTTPDADGKHTCQILDADKFVSHDLFVSSGDFHHYSCTAPCEQNPCNNGGTCFPLNDWKDFKCECPPSVQGKTCHEAPYRDCVELLNAGISKTDIHIIRDKNWILPVYCDQDYMGGGWTMVFKMVSGNSAANIQTIWPSLKFHNQADTTTLNVGSPNSKYYYSRRVKNWINLNPKEARLALYQNQSEVLSLVFNATGSDRENWFSKDRLVRSPWIDLGNETQNYFSLIGDLSSGRAFYINKVNGSCDEDAGWLMASAGKLCGYEARHPGTTSMYSKLGTNVNWNEYDNVGIADVLAVFIR